MRSQRRERILFFKPGPIGDFIHSLPAIYALKNRYPSSRLTVATNEELADLVEENPYIDGTFYLPSHIFRGDIPGLIDFSRKVRKFCPTIFVDMKSNIRSFLIRILSGAPVRLRYRKQRKVGPGETRLHAVENFFETIRTLTGDVNIPPCRVYLKKKDLEFVEQFILSLGKRGFPIPQERPLVAFNPNVSIHSSSRHWPPAYFAELGARIQRDLQVPVFLIGGKGDREYCEMVAEMMDTDPIITAGRMSLGQTGALLKRCRFLVSGDTGPTHLAAAVGTKVIALFGSMDERRAGPYGEGHVVLRKELWCAPCEEKICPLGTTQCMKDLTVNEVFEEARKDLAGFP